MGGLAVDAPGVAAEPVRRVASVMSEVAHATPSAQALTGRSLITSASWVTGSHLVAQTFAYSSLMLLARWLSPASFGTVSVGTAIVWLAVLFVDQGVWGAVIVQRGLTRADLARAFWRCLLTAVVLAAAMAAAAGEVVDRFARGGNAAAVAALALCLPFHAIAVVPTALLQKSMQFRRLAGLTAVANVVSALVALLIALGGLGVWALVARQLVLFGMLAVLSSVLCVPALRAHKPSAGPVPRGKRGRVGERWFFLFSVADSLNGSLSSLTIGGFGNAGLVGLYTLANTIAMAPSTQFSDQVGKVLFAAAASQPETCRERTEKSVLLMSMLMLPLLPVGILIAPTILPGVFGAQWKPMVVAFQVLLVVGVGHAIVNFIGEPLSGAGHMPFRAKVMVARCAATLLALGILVPIGGIRGAALAQLLVFVPYAALYFTAGARRAGTSLAALSRTLRPVVAALCVQLVVSSAVLVGLVASGVGNSVSACTAAVVGLAACTPLLLRTLARMRS
jgi:teichuronic acid exporter